MIVIPDFPLRADQPMAEIWNPENVARWNKIEYLIPACAGMTDIHGEICRFNRLMN